MASIYRRSGRGPYTISYFDEHGVRHTEGTGTSDKGVAKQIAGKRESDVALRRAGLGDPREAQWAEAERKPLRDHLADYKASLVASGRTAQHCELTASRVGKLLDMTGAEHISQLLPADFQAAVGKLIEGGLGKQSGTHYVRTVKAFSTWLWREGRCRDDRLAPLRGYNAAEDRRHERAPLSDEEIKRVVRAAMEGPTVAGLPGDVRAMAYLTASMTGLRAGELRSLVPASFRLDAAPPVVVVAARHSKHRRQDRQQIPPGVVPILRAWLSGRPANAPVFPLPYDAAKMLRHDLAAARAAWLAEATPEDRERWEKSDFLAYQDQEGRFRDFHSLRHGYITAVARVASPRVLQDLARHSTPVLSLGTYSHSDDAERSRAVALLPYSRIAAVPPHVVGSCGNETVLDNGGEPVLASSHTVANRQFDAIWRDGRVDDGDGFENR